MGFEVRREYVLQFEGAMEGAEVRLRSTSIGTALKIRGSELEWEELLQTMADHLVSWNLMKDGVDLKPDLDGIKALEQVMVLAIVKEWMRATGGITAPLDPPSTGGSESSEETSLNWSEIPQTPNGSPGS